MKAVTKVARGEGHVDLVVGGSSARRADAFEAKEDVDHLFLPEV